jgi:hypothetical protein
MSMLSVWQDKGLNAEYQFESVICRIRHKRGCAYLDHERLNTC